jgi:hypothetical protein
MRRLLCAALALLPGLFIQSAGADLLIDDLNNQQVLRFSDSGTLLGTFGSAEFHLGAATPGAIGTDSRNRVYITNITTGDIFRYDSQGNFLGLFGNVGVSVPLGIDFDSAGNLWHRSGAISSNNLVRLNTAGMITASFATHLIGQSDIAIDSSDLLYVPQFDPFSDTSDGVYRMNASGTLLGPFGDATSTASDCVDPESVAFDGAGRLYVLSAGRVLRYSSTGTFLGTFATGAIAEFLTFDPAGNLYVGLDSETGLAKFDSQGTSLGSIIQSGVGGVSATFRNGGFAFVPPVPEPGSAMMLMLLGWFSRRRRFFSRG